jgi:hypothetical protein
MHYGVFISVARQINETAILSKRIGYLLPFPNLYFDRVVFLKKRSKLRKKGYWEYNLTPSPDNSDEIEDLTC